MSGRLCLFVSRAPDRVADELASNYCQTPANVFR
jgi:hypothetical protein